MTQAIMQAEMEAAKAEISEFRETVNTTRPSPAMPKASSPVLK